MGEFANIVQTNQEKPKRNPRNPSLSESEIKLSEDISHSEISQRHDRRNSSHLHNEGRNYLDGRVHRMKSKENNKSTDKLNLSKETDKINERLSKLEILQDKDQSFSTKGPVVAKNGNKSPWMLEDDTPVGRKSENLQSVKFDRIESDREGKEKDLKEFLKNKISDIHNKNKQEISRQTENDRSDLVAFPSDDKVSKNQRDNILNELNSVGFDTDEEGKKDIQNKNEKEEVKVRDTNKEEKEIKDEMKEEENKEKIHESPQIKSNDKELPINNNLKSITTIKQSEDDGWPSGFPSLAENKTNNQDNMGRQSSDILDDILNDNQNENDSL